MTADVDASPVLVLGPMLRYVSETEATIWVETDRPCRVEILGRQAPTFEVAGHHYGLVALDGLRPGGEYEYQVTLDGAVRWPASDHEFPPSVLRTVAPGRPFRLAFGSCRVLETPRADKDTDADALAGCARQLTQLPSDRWPDLLLMIGDQVYADNPGPVTRRFIDERRDPSRPPYYEVADFEEYCALYRESWSERAVRWLFSVVPTAMIFDDHDVDDDWNISDRWRAAQAAKSWWQARVTGAYQAYWLYQYLGNLSPAELAADELYRRVRDATDGAAALTEFAGNADQHPASVRWSFRRTYGSVRVVVVDSRSRRVLADGKRLMADEAEWQWVTESVAGDWEHIVLASSVPPLLQRGIHALEAFSEALCDGAWGARFATFGQRLRHGGHLEHWAAFHKSFAQFEQLLLDLAAGGYGKPPASVTVISGDIHHSYLTEVRLPGKPRTAVWEAVCSPFHQWVPPNEERALRLGGTTWGGRFGTAVARLAGVRRPRIRWRITQGPWFANMVAVLEFDKTQATIRFDSAAPDESGTPRLQPAHATSLT
jgi:hypothetical protein